MKNIGYNLNSFAHDMRSAITCAFVVIPQSISYAIIADLPGVVGIYAAIFGTLFATFFLVAVEPAVVV